MKNVLLKFAGFFVERVPAEHKQAKRVAPAIKQNELLQGNFPSPSGAVALPGPAPKVAQPAPPQIAVALRAWVPAEYAAHLAPSGLQVIAAGGDLTTEQAQMYGAQALIVAAECLGSHTFLLSNPQLPTVFITEQPMMVPARPGVVQVSDPLRVSDLAAAVQQAVQAWPA